MDKVAAVMERNLTGTPLGSYMAGEVRRKLERKIAKQLIPLIEQGVRREMVKEIEKLMTEPFGKGFGYAIGNREWGNLSKEIINQ